MTFKIIAIIELALNVAMMFIKYRSDKQRRNQHITAAKENYKQNVQIHDLHTKNYVKLQRKLKEDIKEANRRYKEFRKYANNDSRKNWLK